MTSAAQLRQERFYLEAAAAIMARTLSAGPQPTAREWALANATVILPTEGRRRIELYPYQAALLDDLSPRRIVLKARQTGMSNVIAIEALHLAITRPDSTVLFVSRNQQAARLLINYCEHTLNGMASPPSLTSETQGELAFPNGSRIISLPANPSTGRGFAATRVYLDEFAFCSYDDLILESVIGTVSTGGGLTILSTANGRNNAYFRLWSGLEGGEWSRHRVHWSHCPRYDDAWAARTRAGMTRQAFAQEYDLDFQVSGDAVFDPADLAAALVGWNPDPDGCEAIVTAWDIGRRRDPTVGISIGLRDDVWHEVAYERALEPYPAIQSRIEKRHNALGGRSWVESNGVGDPVIENLTVPVEPFVTTARTKVQAIQALQLLLQQGRFKFGAEQLGRELALYEMQDQGLIQDSVMAAAIAAFQVIPPPVRASRPAAGGQRAAIAGYVPRG